MLNHVSDRTAVIKNVAIATCCDDFTEFLKILLVSWGFEICDSAREDVLLLAEEGCVEPVGGQEVIWLTRSKYQGTDRLSLPLEIENFWQTLEQRYHRPPRMHIRMAVDMDATVTVDDEAVAVRLSSLSDMGCRFSYYRELVADQQVHLALSLVEEEFRIDSRVIYSHHLTAAADNNIRVGLLFRGIDKEQRDRLRACLILQYLQGVEKEMEEARFRHALEFLSLNEFVRSRLGT
jgi:hypothetical protein